MSEIAIVVKVTVADDRRDEALEVLGRLVEAAEGEPGTIDYVLMADAGDPGVIWFYECYADQASLDAHGASPTMSEVMGAMAGLATAVPELHQATVVRRKQGEPG